MYGLLIAILVLQVSATLWVEDDNGHRMGLISFILSKIFRL